MAVFIDKYSDCSDQELIDFFLTRNDANFVGILYKRYGHLVYGLSLKYLKNKNEAEDAVIQIFTNLLSDLKKHRVIHFKSWLYVYSKNYCLMELRKRQSALKKELELQENPLLLMDFNHPEHLIDKEKHLLALEQALDTLNTDQKRCITLFYFENKSYHDIVGLTGYSSNDVKSHIQNGKRNLKIKIENIVNGKEN